MSTKSSKAAEHRILGWIGWAGLDAFGRLALLTASTAILSRLLSPHDFGVTALVLTFVAAAAVFVGMPFEEALAQRKHLRRAHLNAALGASWWIACPLVLVSVGAGWLLGRLYGEPDIAFLLPVSMLSVFFTGHTAILTALARRLRRFNDVAIASLLGHVLGIAASLAMAWAGAGLWALIANRLLISVFIAFVLQVRIGFIISPRWSPKHIGGFGWFAGLSFLDRLTDNLTYLVFNNVVEAFYGATILGYVNMAMRLIEPIRGAIAATGHNLAFSFFAPVSRDRARLGTLAESVVSQTSLLVTPIFVGLAAVTPVLLPLVAGPGWDDAVSIAICLAIGCALAAPPRLIYTALSASARPEFALLSTVASFVVTIIVLLIAAPLGPFSVGLSRILGDGARALIAVSLSSRQLAWSRWSRLTTLAYAWSLSAIMGMIVVEAANWAPPVNKWSLLAFLVTLGIVVYLGLLAIFARPSLMRLMVFVRPFARRRVFAVAP